MLLGCELSPDRPSVLPRILGFLFLGLTIARGYVRRKVWNWGGENDGYIGSGNVLGEWKADPF
jgi:hypothetical protein